MINPRTFLSVVAGGIASPGMTSAQPRKVSLYANVGPDLTHYEVDVEGVALTRRATVTLPASV
jgi:6-phosphogluconolactonase